MTNPIAITVLIFGVLMFVFTILYVENRRWQEAHGGCPYRGLLEVIK